VACFHTQIAILSDAARLFSDLSGFMLSIISLWIGRRPASRSLSFGYHRAEVIGALASVVLIWALTGVLVYLAIMRVIEPEDVDGEIMFITSCFGLLCNIVMGKMLHGHGGHHHGHDHGHGHGHDHGGHDHGGHDHHKQSHKSSSHHKHDKKKVAIPDSSKTETNALIPANNSSFTVNSGLVKDKKNNVNIDDNKKDVLSPIEVKNDDGHDHGHSSDGSDHDSHEGHEHKHSHDKKGKGKDHDHDHDKHDHDEHDDHDDHDDHDEHGSHGSHDDHDHDHDDHDHKKDKKKNKDKTNGVEVKIGDEVAKLEEIKIDDGKTKKDKKDKHDHDHDHDKHDHDHDKHDHDDDKHDHDHDKHDHDDHDHHDHDDHDHAKKKAMELAKKKNLSMIDDHDNPNVRAALIHVLGDLLQSIGVMIASVVIWVKPEWKIADPACTFLFSILVMFTTVNIVKECLSVLMEGTPSGMNLREFEDELMAINGVVEIHDLHVWSLSAGKPAMSGHILSENPSKTLRLATRLCRRYGIYHSTLQVEFTGDKAKASYLNCAHNIHK